MAFIEAQPVITEDAKPLLVFVHRRLHIHTPVGGCVHQCVCTTALEYLTPRALVSGCTAVAKIISLSYS